MTHRPASADDCVLLARLNRELIRDEGHRNPMTWRELEDRMRGWLAGEYRAALFEESGETVGYALYRQQPEGVHLRQFFIVRHRRRVGLGRRAVEILRSEVWPSDKRITVDVLVANLAAVAFWRTVGFDDYCLTLEIMPEARLTNTP